MIRTRVYRQLPKDGKPGKTNLTYYQKKRGIYFIYENRKLIYIGSSASNLYKTIMRHFQQWDDSRQIKRISYRDQLGRKSYSVEITLYPRKAADKITAEEYRLIRKHRPRDNKLDVYCDMTGNNCESKLLRATEAVTPKQQKKKKAATPKPKSWDILDDEVPF